MKNTSITVYSDGSSRGNPGPGGFGSIVMYPDSHERMRIDEYGGAENPTTNNRMEIQGVLTALSSLVDYYQEKDIKREVTIYTDSGYLVNGATSWLAGWRKNNWMTKTKEPVKNVDLWESLDNVITELKGQGFVILWKQVPGHAGVPGNERCDVVATEYADGLQSELFKGTVDSYSHQEVIKSISNSDIEIMKKNKKPKSGSKSSSSKPAYSYVSYLDGAIATHATWIECEKRVKGKSNTRFKKSFSVSDEAQIIDTFKSGK